MAYVTVNDNDVITFGTVITSVIIIVTVLVVRNVIIAIPYLLGKNCYNKFCLFFKLNTENKQTSAK